MNSILRFALPLTLFAASAMPGYASEKKGATQQPQTVDLTPPLTLERAILIALQNQRSIGIAKTQVDASRARLTHARSSFFPSIAPTFTYSNQLTSATVNGQRVNGTIEQSVTQIGARQLIFDMGKREENVLASKYSARASEFNYFDTRQNVIANVS